MTRSKKAFHTTGCFEKKGTKIPLDKVDWIYSTGLFVQDNSYMSPFNEPGNFSWMKLLRTEGEFICPHKNSKDLLEAIYASPTTPPVELPAELEMKSITTEPEKEVLVTVSRIRSHKTPPLIGDVFFYYNDKPIAHDDPQQASLNWEDKTIIHRNPDFEQLALRELQEAGFTRIPYNHVQTGETTGFEIHPHVFPGTIANLLELGWKVQAEDKIYRTTSDFKMNISSGIDWFELHGKASFGDIEMELPELLAAIKKNEGFVPLGNGQVGVLPQEWQQKYLPVLQMGAGKDDHVRFKMSQSVFLDVLLAELPVKVDKTFAEIRRNLQSFEGLKPSVASAKFKGNLRDYQKEGLGWFLFLEKFHLGGCLADDMGLGKTIQLLALLQKQKHRKKSKADRLPSLIVVPRSLMFNWQDEISRFTPELTAFAYSGLGRGQYLKDLHNTDVILTTYGTLRRDIQKLKDIPFDYAVLDEAQAIKNGSSLTAKAVRLIQSRHRLALTGTPVENRLSDLWSIFEFLNPGMMGKVSTFKKIKEEDTQEFIGKALKPFILRRTKDQVASELPKKTEQVIYCELKGKQKEHYDNIKKHYQGMLLGAQSGSSFKGKKIQVLEALLRLRQTACHPGLVDPQNSEVESSKLNSLMEQLKDILAEGHRALVFSQFTKFLHILKTKLEDENIPYLYLDGRTQKRKELVDTFQNHKEHPVFLISLKAGGVGLNLTAADYVFILDPWWNPAVEAQAVDRAHRIGQTNPVFAYKFIARDTVEEKVLQLQQNKKELAQSIFSEDSSLIKNLTREDLAFLLS